MSFTSVKRLKSYKVQSDDLLRKKNLFMHFNWIQDVTAVFHKTKSTSWHLAVYWSADLLLAKYLSKIVSLVSAKIYSTENNRRKMSMNWKNRMSNIKIRNGTKILIHQCQTWILKMMNGLVLKANSESPRKLAHAYSGPLMMMLRWPLGLRNFFIIFFLIFLSLPPVSLNLCLTLRD